MKRVMYSNEQYQLFLQLNLQLLLTFCFLFVSFINPEDKDAVYIILDKNSSLQKLTA